MEPLPYPDPPFRRRVFFARGPGASHRYNCFLLGKGVDRMIKAVDVKAVLDALPVLDGRSPETTEAEAAAAFAMLAELGERKIFAGSFVGESPWERHARGDELVQVVAGATTLTILTETDSQVLEMSAGMLTVVPQGCWHKFNAPDGVSLMTATPQPTDHSTAEDPRRDG